MRGPTPEPGTPRAPSTPLLAGALATLVAPGTALATWLARARAAAGADLVDVLPMLLGPVVAIVLVGGAALTGARAARRPPGPARPARPFPVRRRRA